MTKQSGLENQPVLSEADLASAELPQDTDLASGILASDRWQVQVDGFTAANRQIPDAAEEIDDPEAVERLNRIYTLPDERLTPADARLKYGSDLRFKTASRNRLGDSAQEPIDILIEQEEAKSPSESLEDSLFDTTPEPGMERPHRMIPHRSILQEGIRAMRQLPVSGEGKVLTITRDGFYLSNPDGGKDIFCAHDRCAVSDRLRRGDQVQFQARESNSGRLVALEVEPIYVEGTGRITKTFLGRNNQAVGFIKTQDGTDVFFVLADLKGARAAGNVEFRAIKGDRGLRALEIKPI